MNLVVKELASRSIARTGVWIESENTAGSGIRWIRKVYETLEGNAQAGVKYALCKNTKLAALKYHCFTYNDKWVVAYRMIGDNFVVYRFIFGAKLV